MMLALCDRKHHPTASTGWRRCFCEKQIQKNGSKAPPLQKRKANRKRTGL